MLDTIIMAAADRNDRRYIVGPSKVVGGKQLYYNMFSLDGGRMLMRSDNVKSIEPATVPEVLRALDTNSDPLLQKHMDRIYDNVCRMEMAG